MNPLSAGGFKARLAWVLLVLLAGNLHADSATRLADLAERKDWSGLEKQLHSGDFNATPQPDGTTALHWATLHADARILNLLLQAGLSPGATNRYGIFPLHLACRLGSTGKAEMLLKAGARIQDSLPGGETPLMTAARTGIPDLVHLLLRHGAEIEAQEAQGQTAIMWAAEAGHAPVVRLLLKAGADPHRTLEGGFNALFFAVRNGHAEAVKALLESGADVNSHMKPTRKVRKGVRNGTSPLILAIENGHFDLAHDLLEAGADPNDMATGYTPLHTLTWVRKPPRGDGEDGDPPPIGSGIRDSLDCVRDLVSHGADVNLVLSRGPAGKGRLNHQGASAFLMAAKNADLPMMKLLHELGADPLLPNVNDTTPFLVAAGLGTFAPGEEAGTEEEALAVLPWLLELGSNLNHVNKLGETAMHGAAYKAFPRVVDFLDQKGADISLWNRPNKYGWTPLLIAEGHRPGNFRPIRPVIDAFHRVLLAHGITPPPPTPRKDGPYEN